MEYAHKKYFFLVSEIRLRSRFGTYVRPFFGGHFDVKVTYSFFFLLSPLLLYRVKKYMDMLAYLRPALQHSGRGNSMPIRGNVLLVKK